MIQASQQVRRVLEAELSQVFGDGRAALAHVAVHHDLVLGVQLLGAVLDLLDLDVDRVLQPAELRLLVLSDVQEDDGIVPAKPGFEFLRGDLIHRAFS